MTYEVVLLSRAQAEFHAIVDWLAEKSPSGAASWLTAYEQLIGRLEHDPNNFGIAPEDAQFSYTIRQALFKTRAGRYYRLLFTIVDQQVRVLHLRGPGQESVNTDT